MFNIGDLVIVTTGALKETEAVVKETYNQNIKPYSVVTIEVGKYKGSDLVVYNTWLTPTNPATDKLFDIID